MISNVFRPREMPNLSHVGQIALGRYAFHAPQSLSVHVVDGAEDQRAVSEPPLDIERLVSAPCVFEDPLYDDVDFLGS